jgi:hypothetical protein
LSSLATKSHPLETIPPQAVSESVNHQSIVSKEETDEDDAEVFVDAVDDTTTPINPAQTTQLQDNLQKLSIEESVPLKRSNSNFSLFSLPPNATWEQESEEAINSDPMAKSLTVSMRLPYDNSG